MGGLGGGAARAFCCLIACDIKARSNLTHSTLNARCRPGGCASRRTRCSQRAGRDHAAAEGAAEAAGCAGQGGKSIACVTRHGAGAVRPSLHECACAVFVSPWMQAVVLLKSAAGDEKRTCSCHGWHPGTLCFMLNQSCPCHPRLGVHQLPH